MNLLYSFIFFSFSIGMAVPFIAVHLGAGKHSISNERKLKKLIKDCCRVCMEMLDHGQSSRQVSVIGCKILEDSVLTNAGRGSQLNFDGEVECDAAIMESSQLLGASVGAIQGVTNPIQVADHLIQDLLEGSTDVIGRLKPIMLVGRGAENYAKRKGVQTEQDLVSKQSLAYYLAWKKAYEEALEEDLNDIGIIQDTLGIICGDSSGIVTVSTSSGGTTLKVPGRVGPAALLRVGLDITTDENNIYSICVSGTGEDIIQSQLAENLCVRLFSEESIGEFLSQLNAKYTFQHHPLYFGALGVNVDQEGCIHLVYSHTTEAFAVGYQFGGTKPTAVISRNPSQRLVMGGSFFRPKT